MDKSLAIRVSTREQNSAVVRKLSEYSDVEVQVVSLATADYLLADHIAVKRKDATDFAMSILDRRLYRQVAALQSEYERVILLIEGDLTLYYSAFSADRLRSAIAYLAVTKGVTILPVASAQETAAMLRSMARQIRKGPDHEAAFRIGKPRPSNPSTVFLVEGLPGIGPRRARQLLERFGTPAAVMRATPDELTQVPGIGPKRSQQIWNALNAPYQVAAPLA